MSDEEIAKLAASLDIVYADGVPIDEPVNYEETDKNVEALIRKALKADRASRAAAQWSRSAPTAPGWYWYRPGPTSPPRVVELHLSDYDLLRSWGIEEGTLVVREPAHTPPRIMGGDWLGPLEVPK
jgi:hypothetical protein